MLTYAVAQTSQLNEVRAERDGYRANFLAQSGGVEPSSSTRSGQEAEHLCASFVETLKSQHSGVVCQSVGVSVCLCA